MKVPNCKHCLNVHHTSSHLPNQWYLGSELLLHLMAVLYHRYTAGTTFPFLWLRVLDKEIHTRFGR